jgi:hypothetical protein
VSGDAKFRNNAFEGDHVTKNGLRAFTVYYIDMERLHRIHTAREAAGLRVYPPGHRHRIKCGWYWATASQRDNPKPGDKPTGPFTSSRKAYQDANTRLEG